MTCPICNKETQVVCLCGYCMDCIEEYGHDECDNIVKQKEKNITNSIQNNESQDEIKFEEGK